MCVLLSRLEGEKFGRPLSKSEAQTRCCCNPKERERDRQTYRQTHPAAPFCSVFPRPLGPLPRCHSRWAFGLLALTVLLHRQHPPRHQPDRRLTAYRCPSFQKKAACLLAGCRHARRHRDTCYAAHPLVTAEEFKLSRSRLSSSFTVLTSHDVAQTNRRRRRRCCRRRQVRLSSVI